MRIISFVLTIFASLALSAGTPGSFAGTVVNGPEKAGAWIYVEGHNHSIRRVYVHDALIRYDNDVPVVERKSPAPTNLVPGTHVRVMAEQDDAGEWRASEIEILPAGVAEKKLQDSTTSAPSNTSKEQ